jgi:hypothetical protein
MITPVLMTTYTTHVELISFQPISTRYTRHGWPSNYWISGVGIIGPSLPPHIIFIHFRIYEINKHQQPSKIWHERLSAPLLYSVSCFRRDTPATRLQSLHTDEHYSFIYRPEYAPRVINRRMYKPERHEFVNNQSLSRSGASSVHYSQH